MCQIALFLILFLITAESGPKLILFLFRFEISGNGHFAFLNSDGVHSSRGFVDIKWICSKPISKTENKLGNQQRILQFFLIEV